MERAADRRTRAQALTRGKADGAGMQFTSVQKPVGNLEETLRPLPGSRQEEGAAFPGLHALHQSPLPAPILPVSAVPQSK